MDDLDGVGEMDEIEQRRLRVLHATRLLDSAPEQGFDRLTRMATRLLSASAALITLVDERRQFFKSARGLGEPWASSRETPLSHSFCQYAVRDRAPLIVSDARAHPTLKTNPAITDLDVIAYAGVPLFVQGEPIGVFCVVDNKARLWSSDELALLDDLAESVVSEIELRLALRAADDQRALTTALLDGLGDGVLAIDTRKTFLIANAAARRLFAEGVVGQTLPADWTSLHRSKLPDGSKLSSEQGALARGLRGAATDGLQFTLEPPGSNQAMWVEVTGRPVRASNGDIIAAIAVYRDVTERKRQSELYRVIVQNLPHGAVFMIDRDMRYVSANGSALAEIMDQSRIPHGELVGRTVAEVVSETNRAATVQMVAATLQGHTQRIEIERGSHHYELVAEPIRDVASGQITSALLFCFDITERKQAHDALAREHATLGQFRSFIEYIPIGITILRDGVITYMNPAMLHIIGHDDALQLVGRPIESLFPEDDRTSVSARVVAAQASAVASRRTRIFRKDGTLATIETIAQPIVFDGATSVVSAVRDVTDEINAEAARQEALATLAMFRLMVEAVRGYAIFQLDPTGRVRTWNEGARAIKGYEAHEIVGQHMRVFYPAGDQDTPALALAIASSNERYEQEGWRVRKGGTRFWASVVITAIRDHANVITGFVKVTRDLTERKQTEDASARALAEKTAMLQEIHHRVKNNLQMISSLLNLQARQIADADARAIFLDTQSRVRSIALLHESLYQSEDLGRVDMQAYVSKLVATLRRAYGESGSRTHFAIEVDQIYLPLDTAVPCGLVINELVTNSLKHAFDASRERNEIRIEMRKVDDSLVLTVADDGAGFPSDFDPDTAGSMGLTIVTDLSTQLRGKAELFTANGATCRVRFPAPILSV